MKKLYAVTYIGGLHRRRMFCIYSSKRIAKIAMGIVPLKGCKPKIEVYAKVSEIKPKKERKNIKNKSIIVH